MGRLTGFDGIVADYVARFRPERLEEQRRFASQPSLKRAIEAAALSRTADNKRHPHQWRIPEGVLREWAATLLGRKKHLRGCSTFDELHSQLADAARGVHGIGALTAYDTATRIGAYLNLKPKKVYLHAGTREGALALGLHRRDALTVNEMPKGLRPLEPSEIEDCLCLYTREIAAVVGKAPTSASRRNAKPPASG
jgi:hypothetical protein